MKFSTDIFSNANVAYLDEMYAKYQSDPNSIGEDWQAFFSGFDLGHQRLDSEESGGAPVSFGSSASLPSMPAAPGTPGSVGVYGLVNAFRTFGYYSAAVNPLEEVKDAAEHPFLTPANFGCNDLSQPVPDGQGGWRGPKPKDVGDLLSMLKQTYCGTFAGESMESIGMEHRVWLHERIEPGLGKPDLNKEQRKSILKDLLKAEVFESFLQTKYLGQKRFSIEGADSLIPLLEQVIHHGSVNGVEEFTLGMAHRGRLNVLVHTMGKPYSDILCEFEGHSPAPDALGDGDVKYHMGYSNDRDVLGGSTVHLSMAPNPSHLELVDPVIEGMVRAKQSARKDTERSKVVPIQIHGEAAFTGQGLVPETLSLSELPAYTTGGTIHVVVNNQIGFTATAQETRFTPFPTDIGRMMKAPIFHVNGDDPEAVVHAARLAIEFRQRFKIDVFIDLICYRRHGHNETDDPTFTQPLMYEKIGQKKTVASDYAARLIQEGVLTPEEEKAMRDEIRSELDSAQSIAKEASFVPSQGTLAGLWTGMKRAGSDWSADTRVKRSVLQDLGKKLTQFPETFHLHRKLKRLFETRSQMVAGEKPLDWGTAEALALASLVAEGIPVRFAGQDAQRGTFSHRHSVLHDVKNGALYCPLENISPDQGKFQAINTMLSELAVLGFEFGISWTDPRRLVIWEAQFGDFANGAQTMIDQFICSSESKWDRMSGLVMLLPHGYAGQGPEHSSARLERYLQLCAEGNMQVCNLTTPAQYFHSLRRQQHRNFRKPLVIMSPKKLLRYEGAVSSLEDLSEGTFETILDDPGVESKSKVKRVAFLSGRVYYTMIEARKRSGVDDIAFIRIEQLYPFPENELKELLSTYDSVEEFLWVQEEPENMGAWNHVRSRIEKLMPDSLRLQYRGRSAAASTATGSHKQHNQEEAALVISVVGSDGAAESKH